MYFCLIVCAQNLFFPLEAIRKTLGVAQPQQDSKKNLQTIDADNLDSTTVKLNAMQNKTNADLKEGNQDIAPSTGMAPNAFFILKMQK